MKKANSRHTQEFPQISRIITALREFGVRKDRISMLLVLSGLFFLLVLNLLVVFFQPPYLQKLMQNPQNQEILEIVLKQNTNPHLEVYLKGSLQRAGGLDKVKEIAAQKLAAAAKLQQIDTLVRENPKYPDGHAYQAVLLYRQRECSGAKKALHRALALDPSRNEFLKLQKVINSCQ